jgi:site-specific DNA recombinase
VANKNSGNGTAARTTVRCAIYTRKSTEEGLRQDFNSLDAQRDSGEAYIRSQAGEGWTLLPEHYDDGGYTGANMERPALRRLLADVRAGKVDCVVVYKVDRLTRSLFDFARIVEVLDKHGASFVAVTQQFNTTSSLGRLTLNILLSFAQFEREIISERTRDKQVLARKRGKWTGGHLPLGYDLDAGCLVINDAEAPRVRQIFEWYLEGQTVYGIVAKCADLGWAGPQALGRWDGSGRRPRYRRMHPRPQRSARGETSGREAHAAPVEAARRVAAGRGAGRRGDQRCRRTQIV